MAHIVTCMVHANDQQRSSTPTSYIGSQGSASSPRDTIFSVTSPSSEKKKSLSWRMQRTESRKYQIFPPISKDPQSSPSMTFKIPNWEREQAGSPGPLSQSPERMEKSSITSGLRLRIKEHNLIRRRKVSVPELGPMTTVQEMSMDSPTIPGRPAHERSMSSPVTSFSPEHHLDFGCRGLPTPLQQAPKFTSPRVPPSPRDLTPLVIPNRESPAPQQFPKQRSNTTGSSPEPPVRPPRPTESCSARTPYTPYTPASSGTFANTPQSAMTATTLPTPLSAIEAHREKPKLLNIKGAMSSQTSLNSDSLASARIEAENQPRSGSAHGFAHQRSGSAMSYNQAMQSRSASAMSHRRNQSESGSIMERGRPRKRTDGTVVGASLKRTHSHSKRSLSEERRAFEELPQGWKPTDVMGNLDQIETTYLQKQALGQALRFEVLRKEDVDSLSKELRYLDDRTAYLRSTYASLRTGRRNLHMRICQYLRSPRVAKFSYESMLKQEESLAELDSSIDDWVNKLEHAENRRTRVRQKLLEHVAAAATLHINPTTDDMCTPPRSPTNPAITSLKENDASQNAASRSPQRVVARVPSMIPEQPSEENSEASPKRDSDVMSDTESTLKRMESIRIYADSDVYDLLADVESEFTKLNGEGVTSPEPTPQPSTMGGRRSDDSAQVEPLIKSPTIDRKTRELHRARSRDILDGTSSGSSAASSPGPTPPAKDTPVKETATYTRGNDLCLGATVFQPGKSVIMI